jgi:hypothetical protein
MNIFWGPKMNELMIELDSRGISYGHLSPALFADMMDEMTKTQQDVGGDPEKCAERWLEALRKC